MTARIRDVSADVPAGDGIYPFPPEFEPERDIFLGCSPTNYHTFVVTGRTEFHPRLFFNRAVVRDARPRSLRAGLFVRFPGAAVGTAPPFEAFLASLAGVRSVNCIVGVREVLGRGADIHIAGVPEGELMPVPFMRAFLSDGFVDGSGRPVPCEVYATRPTSAERLLADAEAFERKYRLLVHLSRACNWVHARVGRGGATAR